MDDKQIYSNPISQIIKNEMSSRLIELYMWIIAACIVAGGIFFDIVTLRSSPIQVLSYRYTELLLAVITLFFPIVYRLIFGSLPLESVRKNRALRRGEKNTSKDSVNEPSNQDAEIGVLLGSMTIEKLSQSSATNLFAYYASSSMTLSQNILNRAGVYLLVGAFVAFSGLAFFYTQTTQLATHTQEVSILISLAPKFGILFFIELVAFFFLRQYRAAMDDFRYYEAIKRNREETLALIRISTDMGKPFDPIDLVKNGSFFSKAGILSKGETTELIESRKLEKNELDLLEKVIDVVSRSKK